MPENDLNLVSMIIKILYRIQSKSFGGLFYSAHLCAHGLILEKKNFQKISKSQNFENFRLRLNFEVGATSKSKKIFFS